jgi:hypothetical protein
MMKIMIEKDNGFVKLPPYSTCRLCRNSMNQACMEICAPKKDYSWFDLKPGINLEDLPRFPLKEFNEEMSSSVRQKVVAVYIAKIVDNLQGVRDERTNLYDPRSRRISKTLQKQGLPFSSERFDPPHQDRSKREDSGERADGVVGQESDHPNS